MKTYGKSMVALGCLILAAFLLAGCENDGGGNEEDVSVTAGETTNDTTSATNDLPEDPNFPDGLHPSSSASKTIAKVFARQISPVSDAGGNDTNTVVCIGDSITKAGYPSSLASQTGMNVIGDGSGGETSGSGASRVDGVLSQYRPAYLCILYGANDVIGAHAPPEEVAANLERIINAAKDNGTIPIVGTLTPMSGDRKKYADEARAVSQAIRAMAGSAGARLADVEAAF